MLSASEVLMAARFRRKKEEGVRISPLAPLIHGFDPW